MGTAVLFLQGNIANNGYNSTRSVHIPAVKSPLLFIPGIVSVLIFKLLLIKRNGKQTIH